MRFNFRKISAIAASVLMTGMTCGFAAAANYPAPFVSGGVANVAIVYGTGAGVSSLDLVQANNIQTSLGGFVEGGTVVVEGGESFTLDKSSDHFNFNEALDGVYGSLDDEDMDFLADGTYDDGAVDDDYTQTISLSGKVLSLFTDNDYNDDEPTIGFTWADGDPVLDYDIEFDEGVPFDDLEDTDLPLMGNTYYVLSVNSDNDTITLLDTAEKVVLSEGETKTIGDKTVSIEYISETEVKFNVDGEITDKLSDTEYEELDDGSYIVANEVMYASKEVGISKVEFSIGAGKITLKDGEEIELNDEDVDNLVADWTGTTDLLTLNIAWSADGDLYLTEEDALTMPLFETIKLVFEGMNLPDDPETLSLNNGETMNLNMGNYDLPIFWLDTDLDTGVGWLGEENNRLVTNTSNVTNYTAGSTNANPYNSLGFDLTDGDRFLITNLDDDLSNIDTWYYEVTSIDWDAPDATVELEDLIGSNDITLDSITDGEDQGDLTVNLEQVNSTHAYLNFSVATGDISYNTVVSEKGMFVTLPVKNAVQTNDFIAGVPVDFVEATKDDEVGQGAAFRVTVKNTTNERLHVSTYNTSISDEEEADDVMVGYVLSDLASKIDFDSSADENDFEITYYGAEVTADVMVIGGSSTVSDGSNVLGNVLVKDTEVSSVATKNLIVVGGSCINSAAAALVGGTKCGAAWTAATGIGSGQFLIKGYANSGITSGLALLVAGYDAEDTVKATTYLTNRDVDTSTALKGTSSTLVAVVTE